MNSSDTKLRKIPGGGETSGYELNLLINSNIPVEKLEEIGSGYLNKIGLKMI